MPSHHLPPPAWAGDWITYLIPALLLGIIGVNLTQRGFCRSYMVQTGDQEIVFRTPAMKERVGLVWVIAFGVALLGGIVALLTARAYHPESGVLWGGGIGCVLCGLACLGALGLAMPQELHLDLEQKRLCGRLGWPPACGELTAATFADITQCHIRKRYGRHPVFEVYLDCQVTGRRPDKKRVVSFLMGVFADTQQARRLVGQVEEILREAMYEMESPETGIIWPPAPRPPQAPRTS